MNWDEIVDDLGPRLFRYFNVRFENNLSDDLTQETLLRLVQKVNEGKFNPIKGSIVTLAFGIAHYVALEAKSKIFNIKEIPSLELELFADDVDFEHEILLTHRINNIRKYFSKLNQTEQQVLSLIVDEELSLKQISIILNLPEGTVKSHTSRAKKKLIQMINKESAI